ncbi:MAG: hypothetical protein WCP06_10360 [Verrucomicrobiota bacterium]
MKHKYKTLLICFSLALSAFSTPTPASDVTPLGPDIILPLDQILSSQGGGGSFSHTLTSTPQETSTRILTGNTCPKCTNQQGYATISARTVSVSYQITIPCSSGTSLISDLTGKSGTVSQGFCDRVKTHEYQHLEIEKLIVSKVFDEYTSRTLTLQTGVYCNLSQADTQIYKMEGELWDFAYASYQHLELCQDNQLHNSNPAFVATGNLNNYWSYTDNGWAASALDYINNFTLNWPTPNIGGLTCE